jgi:hypothetical protein
MGGGFLPRSERVDVDHGELVGRGLDDISIVMRLMASAVTALRSG